MQADSACLYVMPDVAPFLRRPHDPHPTRPRAGQGAGPTPRRVLFHPKRVRCHSSDVFHTRLMLRRAICVSGPDAAAKFYQPGPFTRVGAMPPTVVRLLQDIGSVHTLDDEAHRHRTSMFISMMGPDSIKSLLRVTEDEWHGPIADRPVRDCVPLFDEMEHLLTRSACAFAGIELSDHKRRWTSSPTSGTSTAGA